MDGRNMMFRKLVLVLGMSLLLTACQASNQTSPTHWSYGSGTNIDIVCTTNATFYRQGKIVFSYPGGGCNAGAPHKDIIEREYYWAGGGGLPVYDVPVPDKALIEMVSHYDGKRYRISVDLPPNLAQKMQQHYQVGKKTDQRNWLYFGLAPGGYYEVLLFGDISGVRPDLLLAHGIAKEITDDWRDKKVPVSEQYEMSFAEFNREYSTLFKNNPIPTGMEWAPIMDAYRAKQPKTDQHPVE